MKLPFLFWLVVRKKDNEFCILGPWVFDMNIPLKNLTRCFPILCCFPNDRKSPPCDKSSIFLHFFKVGTTFPIWMFPKHRGTPPKWMVYFMENPMNKWDDLGAKNPIFGNTHMIPSCHPGFSTSLTRLVTQQGWNWSCGFYATWLLEPLGQLAGLIVWFVVFSESKEIRNGAMG